MDSRDFPITEHDPERKAIIEPSKLAPQLDVPEHCLFPFFSKILERLKKKGILKIITQQINPVTPPLSLYEMEHNGKRLAVMTPGLGGPFAGANLEFAIATGCKKFLAFGLCGVLESSIARGQLIVPSAAIRDEGTSYHYIPPNREISADPNVNAKIIKYLNKEQVDHLVGKTWTTDVFYRETPNRIKKRRKEGAIVVDMEAASLFAVAQFRNVQLGYLLAGADDLSGSEWNLRFSAKWNVKFPEKLFWLAADICLTF